MIVILSGAEGSLRFLDKLGMTGVAWNDRGWFITIQGWLITIQGWLITMQGYFITMQG